jgi:hypothetical protein
MINRISLALAFAIAAGCAAPSSGLDGTYRAKSSAREFVLRSDRTFRILNGERTSPGDLTGTYEKVGNTIVFTTTTQMAESAASKSTLEPAKITEYGFDLGREQFTKS